MNTFLRNFEFFNAIIQLYMYTTNKKLCKPNLINLSKSGIINTGLQRRDFYGKYNR